MSRKIEVIWKERVSPRCGRRHAGSSVISRPSKRISPESGGSSPASWAIRVVLPAPLGPMTAWTSRGRISSERSSLAVRPPKRLTRDLVASSASAMRFSGLTHGLLPGLQNSEEATSGEEHHQDQDGSQEELPVLCEVGDEVFQLQQHDGADQRAEEAPETTQNYHDQELAGAQIGRAH